MFISDIYYERVYNLTDGHHWVAKAHCLRIKNLKAYGVRPEHHQQQQKRKYLKTKCFVK
jgi:hypothetical protein